MGFTKGLAFWGVVLVGLGLFATVFYQSGLLQKVRQQNNTLALQAANIPAAKATESTSKDKLRVPLSNPNGDTAIAIIQHHRPLENEILDALDKGVFVGGF